MKLGCVRLVLLLPGVFASSILAQSPGKASHIPSSGDTAQPLLSPGAAYQEALRPVTITRASVANWSLTEQAALAVAIKQAATACAVRSVADYTGDSLIDLGHLCAMGQTFPAAEQAATRYLTESSADKPRMAEAYAIKVDAELRLKDEKSAFATAKEMLATAPYAASVQDATSEAINYMELLFTGDAEVLARARQPKLIALIQSSGSTALGESKIDSASASLAELFEQALVLPELEQLAGDASAAGRSIGALDASIPPTLTQDDAASIAGWRLRYAQIGHPLGTLDLRTSLTIPAKMPQVPARRAITALLLFPDWCAQCLRLARQIPESVFSVQGHEAYMYGLLVETVAPGKSAASPGKAPGVSGDKPADGPDNFNPAYAAQSLNGTSTIIAGPAIMKRFHAVDVPLLIVTDADGMVRFISPVDETALQPGNTVDSAVAQVGSQWPAGGPAPETSAARQPASKSGNITKIQ